MAGSAINLTGMLSAMNKSLGSMGNTVGQGLFNPLLDIQKEQRAEERRKQLEAQKIASQRGLMADITTSNNAAQEDIQNPHATGGNIRAAREALQKAAMDNSEYAPQYLAQDAKLAQQEVAITQRGNVQQVFNLDKELARKDLHPEIRQAYTDRRAVLMEQPGVSTAIAGIEKAARATEIQTKDLELKEHQAQVIKETTQAAGIAQRVMQGANLEELKANTNAPATLWRRVDDQLHEWRERKREADKLAQDTKDNTSTYKGTKYEEMYNLKAAAAGYEAANKMVSRVMEQEALQESANRIAAEVEFSKMSSQQKMEHLLTSKSKTLMNYNAKDIQEAFQEIRGQGAEAKRAEVIDFMATTYQSKLAATGNEEEAMQAAIQAGATRLGVKLPKSAAPSASTGLEAQSDEELMEMLRSLKDGDS